MAMVPLSAKLIGGGLTVLLMVGIFASYQLNQPNVETVTGRYVSNDCGIIAIGKDVAQYAGKRARLQVHHDKFGLIAELDRPLGPFYVQNASGTQQPSNLLFDTNRVTAVRFDHHECVFDRVG